MEISEKHELKMLIKQWN